MTGFDLGGAAAVVEREDVGRPVHIKNESGELMYVDADTPVTITVVGTYSKRYRKAMDAKAEKRLQQRADMDTIREDAMDVTAQCVTEWQGIFHDGAPLECNKANVLRVLKAAPWVREQVETAMDDHAGFFRASSEN